MDEIFTSHFIQTKQYKYLHFGYFPSDHRVLWMLSQNIQLELIIQRDSHQRSSTKKRTSKERVLLQETNSTKIAEYLLGIERNKNGRSFKQKETKYIIYVIDSPRNTTSSGQEDINHVQQRTTHYRSLKSRSNDDWQQQANSFSQGRYLGYIYIRGRK